MILRFVYKGDDKTSLNIRAFHSQSLPLTIKPLACYSDSDLSLKSWNNSLMTQDCASVSESCVIRYLHTALIEAQAWSFNNSVMMEDVLGVRTELQGN